jgi:hypothetical protein
METVTIKTPAGGILGFLDKEPHRTRVRDKQGRYVGYYCNRSNKTRNASGQVIAQGDISVALIL